jgi:putative transposase
MGHTVMRIVGTQGGALCLAAYRRDRLSVTELCALSGLSRQTGDTWIDRDLTHGPQGLDERSRRPSTSPRHTPDPVVAALVGDRRRHPSWGAKTLASILCTRHARWPWPARSTVCAILGRYGLVPKQRQRRVIGPPGQPTSQIDAPNDGWSADFKGHVTTGDGRYGYPLTSTAGDRRVLLSGQALAATGVVAATPVCPRVVNACGLPQRRRTDHGVPCATDTLARLSPLSAWWVRRGLLPECIAPGPPAQNGRHERLQHPLNADPTRPPGANLRAQQQQFRHCRAEFNPERPHEGLDRRTPAACSDPAPRPMPTTRPPLEDPDRFEVRDVSANGGRRWNRQGGHVAITRAGDSVGLEDIAAGVGNVDCGPLNLGRRLERHRRIEDASGRLQRHR